MFHGDRGWREPGFRWGSRAQRRPIEPGSAWDTTGQPEGTPGVAEAMASPREAACAARRANKGQEKTPAKSTAPLARRRRASVVRTTGIERGFGSGLTVRYRYGPRYRHGCAAEVARPKLAKPQPGNPKPVVRDALPLPSGRRTGRVSRSALQFSWQRRQRIPTDSEYINCGGQRARLQLAGHRFLNVRSNSCS